MSFNVYKKRREKLLSTLKLDYSKGDNIIIVLFSGFETDRYKFRQESSFYYLTGIVEPGVVLMMDLKEGQTLYLPNYSESRSKWMNVDLDLYSYLNSSTAPNALSASDLLGFDRVESLGDVCKGFSFPGFFIQDYYKNLLKDLSAVISASCLPAIAAGDGWEQGSSPFYLFSLLDLTGHQYVSQQNVFYSLLDVLSITLNVSFENRKDVKNLSPYVDRMRKTKAGCEIDLIKKAINIASNAHRHITSVIKPGVTEIDIAAEIESVFIREGASSPAFPSIVAGGENTTTLHSLPSSKEFMVGDLVLVDIGAEYEYYASDLTRTYPVSGKFSKRQREVYEIVLKAQEYVFSITKPGMFLNNPNEKEKSLQHLAVEFFRKLGCEKFFIHGIGHMLGIDVHDSGDFRQTKLEPGDVFTIEPGLYIKHENIGIRIEDDYLITSDGVKCLSENLFKTVDEIEARF